MSKAKKAKASGDGDAGRKARPDRQPEQLLALQSKLQLQERMLRMSVSEAERALEGEAAACTQLRQRIASRRGREQDARTELARRKELEELRAAGKRDARRVHDLLRANAQLHNANTIANSALVDRFRALAAEKRSLQREYMAFVRLRLDYAQQLQARFKVRSRADVADDNYSKIVLSEASAAVYESEERLRGVQARRDALRATLDALEARRRRLHADAGSDAATAYFPSTRPASIGAPPVGCIRVAVLSVTCAASASCIALRSPGAHRGAAPGTQTAGAR